MKVVRKKPFNVVIYGRSLMIIALLIIQIAILGFTFRWLSEYFPYIYGGFTTLTVILVIYILRIFFNLVKSIFFENKKCPLIKGVKLIKKFFI